jgi:ATP-binding protein involved in chromosome partitioning
MFRRAQVPILGAVENMSGSLCPHCAEPIDIFPRVPEERAIWTLGVEKLGSVPLDPSIGQAGDTGQPVVADQPQSVQAASFRQIARRVTEGLS